MRNWGVEGDEVEILASLCWRYRMARRLALRDCGFVCVTSVLMVGWGPLCCGPLSLDINERAAQTRRGVKNTPGPPDRVCRSC